MTSSISHLDASSLRLPLLLALLVFRSIFCAPREYDTQIYRWAPVYVIGPTTILRPLQLL